MKKAFALMLAVVMAACLLAGCGSTASSTTTAASGSTSTADSTTSSSVAEAAEFTRGVWDGSVWHSDFAGLSFTTPEGWSICSDEEIATTVGAGTEILDADGKFADILAQANVYDMMTNDPTTGNNVQMMFENVVMEGAAGLTAEAYCDIVKSQLEAVDQMAYTITTGSDVTLGNNTYKSMEAAVTYNGIDLAQYYYVCPMGDYMGVIVITTTDGSSVEDILAQFAA